jgi:hypothetical protein
MKACQDCPIRELQKFHKAMEECFWSNLPPEVSRPLKEAKQNLLLAAKGLIEHELNNDQQGDQVPLKSRSIKME